ncbi:MAG: HDIG domain-containing protein [Syntrophales bacterium]|jgi:putative nucleotidyltransferase with HDIG domain|nr:HDIG domain-containing protein [Syntrophales bacterium]MCK9390371.1 HDIG domain-containing protein [Syntrophales bacterium]
MAFSRDQALSLLHEYIKNDKMLAHSYASETVMRALARRLGQDEEKWGLAGLLHDLDIEQVGGDLTVHGLAAVKILMEKRIDPEIIDAIAMHNEMAAKKTRETVFQHALAAGETVTGLIMATALVYPDRKLASVKVKSVTKRMKEKAFAASVNRDDIRECEQIGIPLDEFVQISLTAMQEQSGQLGM